MKQPPCGSAPSSTPRSAHQVPSPEHSRVRPVKLTAVLSCLQASQLIVNYDEHEVNSTFKFGVVYQSFGQVGNVGFTAEGKDSDFGY